MKNYIREFEIDGKHFILTIRSETKPKHIWLSVGEPLPYKPKTFKQELNLCSNYFKLKKMTIGKNWFQKIGDKFNIPKL